MFLYQTERSDHLKSISSLFYHKIPVSTPKTSPVSGFSAPCTSVLPKSVGLCEFFTKSTIFSDKATPRCSKKGLLQRTPSVTASPCQLPLGGSLGVTVSCESLPLRERLPPAGGRCRVSDKGRTGGIASAMTEGVMHSPFLRNFGLTVPRRQPSAPPRGRCSPTSHPDPRGPCGRKQPACGRWACADRGRG